jgi:hypothetical protein
VRWCPAGIDVSESRALSGVWSGNRAATNEGIVRAVVGSRVRELGTATRVQLTQLPIETPCLVTDT